MEQQILEITNDDKILKVTNVCLDNSVFNDISAKNVKIINANLSNLEIDDAQLGGAYIHNIGMPPKGHPLYSPDVKQRPIKFDDCDLSNMIINNCNLTGLTIDDCNIEGMKIFGVLVSDLFKEYQKRNQ